MLITRIAPSPTGNLHLGTVRTALYNILLARKNQGQFLFRLEDTDKERSKDTYTQEIIEGFAWLGISWDKSNYINSDDLGIIRQASRNEIHSRYVQDLLQSKKAYKCFASQQELEALRLEQRTKKLPEGYDNRGRYLDSETIALYESQNRPYVIRLNLGEACNIEWQDFVRGPMSINTKDLGGDPIIQKADGHILYNFAVVIDDYEMKITHVFRGEDHLTNTAKQIAIYKSLGFTIPKFGHLPLIFTTDKQKLSKRKHGDIAGVEKYRKEGYLPEALVNYLIATSYTPPKDSLAELYSLEDAIENFDLNGISKSPAIYDIQKLNWYNRMYIAKLSCQELLEALRPYLKYDLEAQFNQENLSQLIDSIRGNLDKFSDINANIFYFFEDSEYSSELQKIISEGRSVLENFAKIFDELNFNSPEAIKTHINNLGLDLGIKGKQLFWPIRSALSYLTHGPDLGLVLHLLGRNLCQERLNKALS